MTLDRQLTGALVSRPNKPSRLLAGCRWPALTTWPERETSTMAHTLTRRGFLQASGSATLMAALAGCGFGVGGQGGGKAATLWDISTGPEQQLLMKIINSRHSSMAVKAQFFQNDPYKNKLRVSLGSDAPPDLFYNWGGGILESYVEAGVVQPLGAKVNTDRFLSSVMDAVTFGGQVYGFPNGGSDPVVFFYNKPIFSANGVEPPRTWGDLDGLEWPLGCERLRAGASLTQIRGLPCRSPCSAYPTCVGGPGVC